MTLIKFHHDNIIDSKAKRYFEADLMFPGFGGVLDNYFKKDYHHRETAPSVNVIESDQAYQLEYLVSGFKKEEIKVALAQNVLTVNAEKKIENTASNKRYARKEFSFSSFKRSFTLPEKIDAEQMTAKYEHGILSIVIPKKVEENKITSKVIEIQ